MPNVGNRGSLGMGEPTPLGTFHLLHLSSSVKHFDLGVAQISVFLLGGLQLELTW